jgi:hypothetical protein
LLYYSCCINAGQREASSSCSAQGEGGAFLPLTTRALPFVLTSCFCFPLLLRRPARSQQQQQLLWHPSVTAYSTYTLCASMILLY